MQKIRGHSSRTPARSFTGCATCRRRKIKCDEIHPICGQCYRGGLVCAGYKAEIRFVQYAPDGSLPTSDLSQPDGCYSRRVLLTGNRVLPGVCFCWRHGASLKSTLLTDAEVERAAMSRQLQKLVQEHELEQVLHDLDSEYELQTGRSFQRGPFGLFRVHDDSELSNTPVDLLLGDECQLRTSVTDGSDYVVMNSPGINLPALLMGDILAGVESDTSPVSDVNTTDDRPNFSVIPSLSPKNGFRAGSTSLLDFHIDYNLNRSIGTTVSTDAHFLLNHYKSQMGKLFSPLWVPKPPWSILHFPTALSALSELKIFKKTTHAKSSLLYSILAVSAFNWDNISLEEKNSTTYWWTVGEKFYCMAKEELEWTCESELDGDGKSKYKDMLMAILTMVTVSLLMADMKKLGHFCSMLKCLSFSESRKVKLLHYIYLYLRVIEESTHIYPSDKEPLLNLSHPFKKMLFPSLRTHGLFVGRDLDALCGGDFEYGLFGEHGDEESRQTFTAFRHIYGFSSELLSFISRTTYLANEITVLKNKNQQLTVELEDRCKELENEICALRDDREEAGEDIITDDPISMAFSHAIMCHLTIAIHSAIVIFFYRRVRELHPLLLQSYVDKTITSLELFEQEKRNFSFANCGIVWPGFIAATEAIELNLRERSYRLLKNCAQTSGMHNYDVAAKVLQYLWRAREDSGNSNMTWMELVKNRQLPLVMT
ncbi:fungal-specific transcription factor domain-containing protein [Lipomyces kononenkoae]